jgi:hypothetical protein
MGRFQVQIASTWRAALLAGRIDHATGELGTAFSLSERAASRGAVTHARAYRGLMGPVEDQLLVDPAVVQAPSAGVFAARWVRLAAEGDVAGTPSARSAACSLAASRDSRRVTLIVPSACSVTVHAASWVLPGWSRVPAWLPACGGAVTASGAAVAGRVLTVAVVRV